MPPATPSKPGVLAYAKSLVAFTGTAAATLTTMGLNPTPAGLAAGAAAALGDLGTYAVRNGNHGPARFAKAACSWTGTLVAAVPLALTSYRGEHAVLLSGMDLADWTQVGVLALRSVLVGIIPNAEHAFTAGGLAGLESELLDVPAPEQAATGGTALPVERLETTLMQALTPELLAQMDAAKGHSA